MNTDDGLLVHRSGARPAVRTPGLIEYFDAGVE
jgi:hypothetical protein